MSRPNARPPRPAPTAKTLLGVAAWGAITVLLAYVIGRGTIVGMVAVFAVIGIGQRLWARWYRRRHQIPM